MRSMLLPRFTSLMLACCVLAVSGAALAAPPVSPVLRPLLDAAIERNAIGDQVALSKWDSGKPVLDAGRETAVLQGVRALAPAHGVDAELAARFFAAQIESNKFVQYQLLDRWHVRDAAPAGQRPQLAQLRARLDQLQLAMLDGLAAGAAVRQAADCPAQVAASVAAAARAHHLDALHRDALVRSFGDYCQP